MQLSFEVTGFHSLPLHRSREQLQCFGYNETAFHRSLEELKVHLLLLSLFDLKRKTINGFF